jgi:hypothetical protein
VNLKATRDRAEPARRQKLELEGRLVALLARRWRRQAARLKAQLAAEHPERKALPYDVEALLADDPSDPQAQETLARLVAVIATAAQGGVTLFELSVDIGFDWTLANAEAAAWARSYTYELVRNIDQTTVRALQRLIGGFVETPGMTIGDVMAGLPFGESRALSVATTEITRAYASGQRLAGEALAREYPDVKVVKTWFTNADDRTCLICAPLHGKEVGLNEEFAPGINQPPAHPRCRCWISNRTRINEQE